MYMQSMQPVVQEPPKTQEEDTRMQQAQTQRISTEQEVVKPQKVKARASRERSLQEYYDDCKFDEGVSSYTDYMQSQFTKHNMYILPPGQADEENFNFYNKGKDLWKESGDLRDDLEDKFRH